MNKVMKRILVFLVCLFLSASMVASLGLMAGCNNKKPNPNQSSSSQGQQGDPIQPEITDVEISFAVSEKSLTVGDEEYLFPDYKKIQGFTLSYSSSDTSIVAVDNSGKISAMGEGSATVKATYSNGKVSGSAGITVHSSFGGYLPELKTMGVASDIAIALNDSYKVLPYVTFNGKQFSDVSVSYTVANNSIASVDANGVIVAKAKGKTQLIMQASWRGKDKSSAPTLQKVVNLSVIDDVRFYNDGESISDEQLYTFASFEGQSYKNSIPCNFTVQVNGAESKANFTIEDESVIRQQGDLLVVQSFGSTNILVQKTVDGETYSKTFTVTVNRVEKSVYETVPLFGTVDGEYFDASSGMRKSLLQFIGESDQAVDAYQNSRALTVEGGKILGVESSSLTQMGSAQISVGTNSVIYHFNLQTLAKVMSTKEDIKSLELSNAKRLNGYYQMVNDIDASGVSLNHVVTGDASFAGVFEGNGYSIKNLTLNANSSLFGVLNGASATIKNLALINLNATKSYFLAQNTLGDGLRISNVYVALSESTVTPRGLTARTAEKSVCENVVIEYLGENARSNRNYEERWTWQGLIGGLWTVEKEGMLYARDSLWKDVYVISPFVVSFRSDEKKDGSLYAAMYGYGANESTDIYGNQIDGVTNYRDNPNLGSYYETDMYYNAVFTNLYHYESYEALANASANFESFSSDYWIVANGRVIWKSLYNENLQVKFFDGETDLGTDAKIVGLDTEISVVPYAYGERLTDFEVSLEHNDYVVWDEINGVLRLEKIPEEGAVTVKMQLSIKVGESVIYKTVNLMAIGELVNVQRTYDLIDATTGKMAGNAFPMDEIVQYEEVLSVYQGSTPLTYNSEDGTLLGLTANVVGFGEQRSVQPVELTINTYGKVYVVKVMVYSKVITTANDLQFFNQTLPQNASNSYDGYYVLANNIVDYSTAYNTAHDNTHGLKAFTGTFDGNGYCVSVKVNKGLFGVLGNGAVVKNVALKDMQIEVSDDYTVTAMVAGYIQNSTDVAVVKDVYISLDQESNPYRQYLSKWFTTAMLVSNNASKSSKFANVVIEADIFHSDYNEKGGAQPCLFRYWDGIDQSARGGEYAQNTAIDCLTNVYVISKDRTGFGGIFRVTAGIDRLSNRSMALSYNDFFMVANGVDPYTTLYLPNTYTSGSKKLVTMRRYDDYTAMASANNDYSLFNSDCWEITGKTPVWKNK